MVAATRVPGIHARAEGDRAMTPRRRRSLLDAALIFGLGVLFALAGLEVFR